MPSERGSRWGWDTRARRMLAGVAIALLGLWPLPGIARAQPDIGGPLLDRPPDEDAPEFELTPAYETDGDDRSVPDERFTPMVLRIGPGQVQGMAVIEHRQDGTQAARTMVPFAATPGRWTEVPLTLAMPPYLEEVSVALFAIEGQSQRQLRARTIDLSAFGDDREARLTVDPGIRLVGMIGSSSLGQAARSGELLDGDERERFRRASVVAARLEGSRVPSSPIALDAFELMVVRGSEAASLRPAQLGALRGWVRSGGRLLIVADEPGDGWSRLLPPRGGRGFIRLDEPREAPLPEALAEILTPEAAEPVRAPQRMVDITASGRRHGWRVDWPTSGNPDASSDAGEGGTARGILASGPIGLGWAGVVGIEPRGAVPAAEGEALRATWGELIRPALEVRAEGGVSSRYYAGGSGATERERGGIRASADASVDVAELGHAPFIVIGAAVLGLMLMVGPVDMLVLRRLGLRHRSWLTALVWCGLATLVGFAGPRFLRDSETQIGSVRAVDLIVEGEPGEAAASRGWESELLSIFSGPPLSASIGDAPDRSAWRGVSPLNASTGPTSFDPLGLLDVPAPGAGGPTLKRPLSQGMWTFRTLLRRSPAESPLHARVSETPDRGWSVVVTGLSDDERIAGAWLHFGSERAQLELEPWAGTGLRASLPYGKNTQPVDDPDHRWMADVMPAGERARSGMNPASALGVRAASDLPGAAERGAGFNRYLASDRWAVVQMVIEGGASPIRLDAGGTRRARRVVRLLAPIRASSGEPTTREGGA